MSKLTPKQQRFIEEYLIDLNATAAARRAGYSERTADRIGPELLGKTWVAEAIQAAKEARAEKTGITAERVLEHLWEVATADPNELIQFRRVCCRHCYGKGFRYQYTAHEMAVRRAVHDKKSDLGADQAEPWDADGMFDEGGGIGFDARKDPNPDCPECHGEGVGMPFIPDSRTLQGPARRLYAGVKITKDGLQVQMRSQDNALGLLFDHLGLHGPRRREVSGPGGGPIKTSDMSDKVRELPKGVRDEVRAAIQAALGKEGGE